jgi:hypothetical protein
MRSSQWCWWRLKSSGMLQLVHSLAVTKYTAQVIFTKLCIHLWCHHTKHELYTTNARVTPPKFAQLASWYCWCKIIIYNGRAPFSNMTFTLTNRNGQMKLPIWLHLCSVAMDTPLTVWPNSQVPTLCCLSAIYSSICHVLHCCLNSCKGLCTYNLQQPIWSFWATLKR